MGCNCGKNKRPPLVITTPEPIPVPTPPVEETKIEGE